jgi:hypothetical protein
MLVVSPSLPIFTLTQINFLLKLIDLWKFSKKFFKLEIFPKNLMCGNFPKKSYVWKFSQKNLLCGNFSKPQFLDFFNLNFLLISKYII